LQTHLDQSGKRCPRPQPRHISARFCAGRAGGIEGSLLWIASIRSRYMVTHPLRYVSCIGQKTGTGMRWGWGWGTGTRERIRTNARNQYAALWVRCLKEGMMVRVRTSWKDPCRLAEFVYRCSGGRYINQLYLRLLTQA
jgi:hypothetical protein